MNYNIIKLRFLSKIGIKYYIPNSVNKKTKTYHREEPKKLTTLTQTSPKQKEQHLIRQSINILQINIKSQELRLDLKTQKIVHKSREIANRVVSIDELHREVINFEGCSLKNFAMNTVFSEGNSRSTLVMVIGEAPGAAEDKLGIPFCGRSGKLLDNILGSIQISRKSNAYITNAVFWRPPANRRPTVEEIEICRPLVEKHIALINPKILLLTGNTAISSILNKDMQISKIQGNIYSYQNQYITTPIYLIPLFHPSYLLRQPIKKKLTWKNMLKIKKLLNKHKDS